MDSAKDKHTGQIVDGEQLWYINNVDKDAYVCRGCNVPINPVSYEKGLKRRPHFRELNGHPHKGWCKIEGEIELIKKAKKQKITTPQGFPASFPNKLELIGERDKIDKEKSNQADDNLAKRTSSQSEEGSNLSTTTSKWTARTIRPICRTYCNFPKDRDLPLLISNLYGDTYNDVIRRLSSKEIVIYTKNHLLYAPLGWQKIHKDNDKLIIYLGYGYWINNKLIPYKVQVNIGDWSKSKINYVLEELNIAIYDSKQVKDKDKKTKVKSWLFFIGEQSLDSPEIFIVNDHRLICCLTLEMKSY
ncbi:hypothetical protein JHD48_09695 [Sulfurimonas sp. SAG-AH-194-I05]|nr:hypothetical protein [Sulfurimonas sp. SAG-AH-194-I05]MDF1876008.1 hypothetical protein [Sulfurimonas sp. SAG-AH-194-I05]